MDYMEKFVQWKTDEYFGSTIKKELEQLDPVVDAKEIEDRFCNDLGFGTGGLRGIMGAGTNRMNKFTVGKASVGLSKYLLNNYPDACKRGVVIGYDTRRNSEFFARTAADVFSACGIRVYLHIHARPVSQLSFAVQFWNCVAGIMITASHNPKEYNGYKVYDEYGCQLVPKLTDEVTKYINSIVDYKSIVFTGNENIITMIDETDSFIEAIRKQRRYNNQIAKADLKIVYTPLHGTGLVPVTKTLLSEGFTSLTHVTEQIIPDGDFSTVDSPNPEDKKALEMGIAKGIKEDADIILGTDPDCDRVGIALNCNGEFKLLNGNQIGALLMDYILNSTDVKWGKPAVIKSVVTGELGADIARKRGITVFDTLTGFKYIGEKITQFEKAKNACDEERAYDFLFGYEESYGYLVGNHARDKDAVVSSLLICEMAAKAKDEGKTLVDKLDELYDEFGYYQDTLDSISFKGKYGAEKIQSIMTELREKGSPFSNTSTVIDYQGDVETGAFGPLPHTNLIKYILDDGSWIAIRPSGTEPKIKIYYNARAAEKAAAETILNNNRDTILKLLGMG